MKYVIGNWKMHTTVDQAVALAATIEDGVADLVRGGRTVPEVIICPPFVSLRPVQDVLAERPLRLGAQDMHWEDDGSYTGEISPPMLKPLASYVILGHSERRKAGETDLQIAKKLAAAAKHDLIPILCVGESDPNEVATEYVSHQLRVAFEEMTEKHSELIVAYEPSWDIGGSKVADITQVDEVATEIRTVLEDVGRPAAIIYGGSVTADSVTDLLGDDRLDGFLIGHASLDEEQFVGIVEKVAKDA